jgi:phosphoribosylaminoimidazole-succinocarboxamide synthase
VQQAALGVFRLGQRVAATAGLILVDTKYEFGLIDGKLALIDEVHTPDSSRYWIADTYAAGNPQNYDKEFLRLWFVEQGYRGDGPAPQMPDEFVAQVAQRYIDAFERLTGDTFEPGEQPVATRIRKALL